MNLEFLKYEIVEFTGIVTIDSPPVNALSKQVVAEIAEVVAAINKDIESAKVRAVVLTAHGKYFCAGADLKERMDLSEKEVAPTVENLSKTFTRFAKIPVPTIAALQGSAFGGGLELALAADIRILVENAQVGLRETALAVIPGAGGTQRLSRLIGPAKALLWIASARLFEAQEALVQGAVDFIVPQKELMATALSVASDIAKNGPVAVREAKKAILEGLEKSLDDGLKLEHKYYKNIISTQDRIEGLNAFVEKRKPLYKDC